MPGRGHTPQDMTKNEWSKNIDKGCLQRRSNGHLHGKRDGEQDMRYAERELQAIGKQPPFLDVRNMIHNESNDTIKIRNEE